MGIHPFDRTAVQRMDTYEERYCFDLADFVTALLPEIDKSQFMDMLGKAVVYKAYTPMFLSEHEVNAYCGLSCYIPHPSREDLNDYYKALQWYKDSGMEKLNILTNYQQH